MGLFAQSVSQVLPKSNAPDSRFLSLILDGSQLVEDARGLQEDENRKLVLTHDPIFGISEDPAAPPSAPSHKE